MPWNSPGAVSRAEVPAGQPVVKARIAERLRGTAAAPDPAAEAYASLPAGIAAALFPNPLIPAAVLVPLVDRESGLTVLLTRRTDRLRDHPGQISFPGGRIDPGDAGPLAAALRETHEELGIAPELVDIFGYLPPHPVVTGFVITPVVGLVPAWVGIQSDPSEVAEVFELPLKFIVDPANVNRGIRQIRDLEVPVLEYRYGAYRIWGATAQILYSLSMKII